MQLQMHAKNMHTVNLLRQQKENDLTDSCLGPSCSKHRLLKELVCGQNVNCSIKFNI